MSLKHLNQWVPVFANIAVVIGILLLLFELRQNTESMRAQTRNELSFGMMDINLSVANDPTLAEAFLKDPKLRSPSEELRVFVYFQAMFRYWENVHYQYREGMFDEREFAAHRERWKGSFQVGDNTIRVYCTLPRGWLSAGLSRELEMIMSEVGRSCEGVEGSLDAFE